jgi:hypothetical protein
MFYICMKREKHEVAPPLVVGRRGFQNDHDHPSYILEAGSLRMQMCREGGVGVGASVDGAIIIVILGDHDPLGSSDLLFQVMNDSLLLLPSEGDGALAHPCLIQGPACGSHGSNESLLLSVRDSGSGLSRSHGVILLPLGGGGGDVGVAVRHGRQDGDG